jgi:hypothetical protein
MSNPKTRPAAARRPAASTSRARQPRVRAWSLVAVAVAIAAVVVLLVVRVTGEETAESAHLEHVHGLGVDPADGALYAGSHHGLFRSTTADGTIGGPVADRVQDFMGFTVAGPGHFLASGHPGAGQDGPGALGLLESTDAGQTWTSRSLASEADFHALEYRHDTVYGVDAMSGGLMVSTNMEDWETRSKVPIADFAVSPTDAATLVATTEKGPALSTDGGRTFNVIEGAPLLLLVSWTDDGSLFGVDPNGTVYTSTDGTSDFAEVGELRASPEALHAENRTTIYAAASGGLWASTDGGKTFDSYPGD